MYGCTGGSGVAAVHCGELWGGGLPHSQRHTLEHQQLVQFWRVTAASHWWTTMGMVSATAPWYLIERAQLPQDIWIRCLE